MNDQFEKLFNNFIKKPGAESKETLQACTNLNLHPPSDYLEALCFTNGGEGFINQSYFRLYSIEELLSLNKAYQVKNFAPALVIFGSNGCGEAFGFDTRQTPPEIIQIPFIPMDFEYAKSLEQDFLEFLQALSEKDDRYGLPPQIEMSSIGKEVHEIQPIVFGGSSTDEKNKALVSSEQHAELSVFWNTAYQRIKYDGENK